MVDKKLALAMLEGPCPECNGAGGFTERTGPTDVEQYACPTCLGRGVYYVLDPDGKLGLRVRCDWLVQYGERDHNFPDRCQKCQGRGWVPTDDPWAYVRAAWPILNNPRKPEFESKIVQALSKALDERVDPGQAAFDVVAEVLLKGEPDDN